MIDIVYQTVKTILNKENRGYVSPTEFNFIANNVQREIFNGYFENSNRYFNREGSGLIKKDGSDLPYSKAQKFAPFNKSANVSIVNGRGTIPDDLYYTETDGVSIKTSSNIENEGVLVEELKRNDFVVLNRSSAKPTELFPIMYREGREVIVSPSTITELNFLYLKTPSQPKWTYTVLPNGMELFDPSNNSFQDFELHESELTNIIIRVLSYFGLNLQEKELFSLVEKLKINLNTKNVV